jgi:hypothetical protein
MANPDAYKIVEKLVKEEKKTGEKFNRAKAAKELGIGLRTLQRWIKWIYSGKRVERRVGKKDRRKPKEMVRGTLEDFKNQFDDSVVIPNAIEKGIEKHLMKPDGTPLYMRDQDFREACDVGPGKWRRYAEDYKHLQVKKDGVIYWGHPQIIDELRKAVNR